MKKLFLVSLLLSFCIGGVQSQNASLFEYNLQEIELELAEVSLIESYVLENPGTTIDDLSQPFIYGNETLDYNILGFNHFVMNMSTPWYIPVVWAVVGCSGGCLGVGFINYLFPGLLPQKGVDAASPLSGNRNKRPES